MRLKLTMRATRHPALLPFNYAYPLSAAIYKIIQRADAAFAAFLHGTGYGKKGKSFKLFTFSDLRTPFVPKGDRMQLMSGEAELIVCFYLPVAAENFIRGLFMHQQLEVADQRSQTVFRISQVESLAVELGDKTSLMLQPLSPLVVGRKNSRGHYDYRSPEDADFSECLYHNWMEKCAAVGLAVAVGEEKPEVSMDVLLHAHPLQQRLITIKDGTEAETKIRGYTRFRLRVNAPVEMLEVAMGAGLGLHNAMGMGCVSELGF